MPVRSFSFVGIAIILTVTGLAVTWSGSRSAVAGVPVDATSAPPPPLPASLAVALPATKPAPLPEASVVDIDWQAPRLLRRDRLAATGTRTPMTVAPVADGIRCPDGRHLPLLNGVASAPAIIREAERGPLPPVVALLVDVDGWEWYEHADGSITTSRPQRATDQRGQQTVQTLTLHIAHLPPDALVAPEPPPNPRVDR